MKSLLVLRHAKSAYPPDVEADFDRPLSKRGRKDAPRMADLLVRRGLTPDLAVSSPAARARQTTEVVVRRLGLAEEQVTFDERLYLAEPATIAQVVADVEDRVATLLVVGHNPGMEEWVTQLCGARVRLPTAGLASVELPSTGWGAVGSVRGELQWLVVPKLLKGMA